jgi:hypothetical protein
MIRKKKRANERLSLIVKHIFTEKFPGMFFICGEAGERDSNGLPEKIFVCPAYGAGWSAMYTKDDRVVLGEGA